MLLSLWLYLMSCLMSEAWDSHSLHQGFLKYRPWASSTSTTGHSWEMHILRSCPRITESETLPVHSGACQSLRATALSYFCFLVLLTSSVSQAYLIIVISFRPARYFKLFIWGQESFWFPPEFSSQPSQFISLHWGSSSWKEMQEMGRRPFRKWGEGIIGKHSQTFMKSEGASELQREWFCGQPRS